MSCVFHDWASLCRYVVKRMWVSSGKLQRQVYPAVPSSPYMTTVFQVYPNNVLHQILLLCWLAAELRTHLVCPAIIPMLAVQPVKTWQVCACILVFIA